MRRRKFIIQSDTRGKETNNNLLQTMKNDICNGKNRNIYPESEKKDMFSRVENKSVASGLCINKYTSIIGENDKVNNNEKKYSTDKTAIESPTIKNRREPNKAGQYRGKTIIHKIKVRNPKREIFSSESSSMYEKSTETITCESRDEIENDSPTVKIDKPPKDQVPGTSSPAMCRICHGGDSISEFGQLVSACSCRGTIGRVHIMCLETWLTESGKSRCELCYTSYAIRRIHKYGILRALTIWILSQNSKQLAVDMLTTILMMPLAVLAAWLSATTLVNIMAHEDGMAAWPLVYSFMLSCTTLVCYYCWIVSAATRHAIGWWIWYQSQYEVKLLPNTKQEVEDCQGIPGNT